MNWAVFAAALVGAALGGLGVNKLIDWFVYRSSR